MSFRVRLFLALFVLATIPLVLLAVGIRERLAARLADDYETRVTNLISAIRGEVAEEGGSIGTRLSALAAGIVDDNRFRLAAVEGDSAERPYLLNYAGTAMRLAGLSLLQIQDADGRILSSGHFRNDYGRLEPGLPRRLASMPDATGLVRARTADRPILVLARADSFRLGLRRFSLVGGVAVGPSLLGRLGRGEGLTVTLRHPAGVVTAEQGESAPSARPGAEIVGEVSVPYVDASSDAGRLAEREATFLIEQTGEPLRALQRSIDLWFLLALLATAAGSLGLAGWASARISRPLTDLARKTSRVDLDRLDVDFSSVREDEIGALSRLLGSMIERLRTSAARLREAERRATIGEIARQVNHDIKNGLTPIRNVVRHLGGVAEKDPAGLAPVFRERRETLESSISYLEQLATNYARLRPRIERRPCDLNEIVREVAANLRASSRVTVRTIVAGSLPPVTADAVILRRILENLVVNAIESLEADGGGVAVETALAPDDPPSVRVTVADEGRGMNEEELERIFDDFYTTKSDGTGLGLSVVRRLVADVGGTVRATSRPGVGTRFTVDLPASEPVGAPSPGALAGPDGEDAP
ncbi:MAG: PAS domain-containing sensor histidine kinase [Gemmatimonadota bacterium]